MKQKINKQGEASEYRVNAGRLLDEYTSSLQAMNRSPKTVTWYLEILKRYFDFLESHSLLKAIKKLGTQELKMYILHLQESERWSGNTSIRKPGGKLSPHSIQGHARAIKAFWSWLENEGQIKNNPLTKFPLPKAPDKPVSVLSNEQITSLLALVDRSTPRGARYYAILLLLLDTGVRISELASIRIDDLDLQHDCIRVVGKGQKIRSVPMSKLTRKEILRYINHFRILLGPQDSLYLFSKSDGKPITINSVQQFLRRLVKRINLNGIRCSPHTFRHTFATKAITNGANVFVLRDIMGHSSLITTMKYTHLQPHDLQVQHAKFSPVTNLGITNKSRNSH